MRVGRVLAAGSAVAMLALAGCGGSGSDSAGGNGGPAARPPATSRPAAAAAVEPAALVRAATARTVTASSAKTSMVITGGPGLGSAAVRGTGMFDFKARRGQLTFTIPQLGDIFAVFENGVVYQRFPARYAPTFGGRRWLKVDVAKLGGAGAGGLGGSTQLGGNDPSQGLAYLRAAETVTDLGPESVRGEPARHYRAVIDLQKAAAELPAEARSRIQRLLRESGSPKRPTDVWIDAQGRVRKLVYALPKMAGAQGGQAGTVSVEYFGFGTPVPAPVLPPASQVLDAGALLGR
jgi:hypothetical protein